MVYFFFTSKLFRTQCVFLRIVFKQVGYLLLYYSFRTNLNLSLERKNRREICETTLERMLFKKIKEQLWIKNVFQIFKQIMELFQQ